MTEVSQAWQQEGRFWLPGSDERVLGRLDYNPETGLLLHLPEAIIDPAESFEREQPVAAIHGETLDGWPMSLLDAAVLRPAVVTMSTQYSADVDARLLVRGPHVEHPQEITATFAHVSLSHLDAFVRGASVDTTWLEAAPEDRSASCKSVHLPWGTLSIFAAGGPTRVNRDEVHFKVRVHAQLAFDAPRRLPEVDAAIEPLRHLVEFSTRQRSTLMSLGLDGNDVAEDAPWQHRRGFKIVRAPAPGAMALRDRRPYALLLNPATVPDGEQLIADWYALRLRLGAVWRLFFSTITDAGLSVESQLLNLTSFAEGYHRTLHDDPRLADDEHAFATEAMLAVLPDERHRSVYAPALRYANAQSQRARIRWLARRAARLLTAWDLDVEQLVSQGVDSRNWLTHWGDRGKDVLEGEELEVLNRRLYVILATNLLLDLGLDEAVVLAQLGSGLRGQGLP